MTKHVFVLFIGRTGSSYLMQLFNCLKHSKVLCTYGEIFTSIEPIVRLFKSDMSKQHVLKHPCEYIQFIDKNISDPYLFSKIQIHYLCTLKDETIKKILTYKDCKIIIVRRDPLASYISEQKALLTNKWSKKDTTNLKIKIDVADFINYRNKNNAAYNKLIKILSTCKQDSRNKKYLTIKYEDLHKYNNHKEKLEYLVKQLKHIGLRMTISEMRLKKADLLKIQDRNTDIKDRITNYKELQLTRN